MPFVYLGRTMWIAQNQTARGVKVDTRCLLLRSSFDDVRKYAYVLHEADSHLRTSGRHIHLANITQTVVLKSVARIDYIT